MGLSGCTFVSLVALFTTASVSGLQCWKCEDASSHEECFANRVSQKCSAFETTCSNTTLLLLNTTTGKTRMSVKKGCTFAALCDREADVCAHQNSTVKPPMEMLNCSFNCCPSGPDCVNSTGETPPASTSSPSPSSGETPPASTSPIIVQSTIAPTTKPPAQYSVSAWATDMRLCKQMCCGGTPAQIWQNRSCCPLRDGGCVGVAQAKQVKCEDTYCNQQHCGACQFGGKQLMIMIAVIVSVLYEFVL